MAQRRRTNPIDGCPLTAAIAATGGKWKLLIISWLGESPRGFGELRSCCRRQTRHAMRRVPSTGRRDGGWFLQYYNTKRPHHVRSMKW